LALAVAACYGLLAALGLLALMGITVAIHEGTWAATVTLLSILTAAAVAVGIRKHGEPGPAALALPGAGLIAYAMIVDYDRLVEAAGFLLFAGGVGWDYWIRRYRPIRRLRTIRLRGRSEPGHVPSTD